MGREVDVRRFETSRVSPERSEALRSVASEVSQALPGGGRVTIESFDPTTGNPATTKAEGGRPEPGDYVRRALEHVQAIGPALGLRGQAAEFVADPTARQTSSGATAVHLQQRYKGIPIFQASTTVRFTPNGALRGTAGSAITVEGDLPVTPTLTVQEAVVAAARHVAEPQPDEEAVTDQSGQPLAWARVDVSDLEPTVLTTFPGLPERPAVLTRGPFAQDINASLMWFPLREGPVLGWSVRLTMPGHQQEYQTIVDATSGEILYCKQLVHQVAAVGTVFEKDPSTPRVDLPFPRPLHDYKLPRPAGGQDGWRWCSKCQGLFFGGGGPSVCPRDGQPHDNTGLEVYRIVVGSTNYPGEPGWKWCGKCGALFSSSGLSKCPVPPAGSAHTSGGGDYRVLVAPYAPGQHGWRRCMNCRGMFWALLAGSVCPANGAAHNGAGSPDYALNLNNDLPPLPAGSPTPGSTATPPRATRPTPGTRTPTSRPASAPDSRSSSRPPRAARTKRSSTSSTSAATCTTTSTCSASGKRTATSRTTTSGGAVKTHRTACRATSTRASCSGPPTS
jgi:hypothetical protein